MKKNYRRGVNLTSKQAETLDRFVAGSGVSFNEAIRQFIDIAANELVHEVLIWTKYDNIKPRRIILKNADVRYFKRFKDTSEAGDWASTFAIGLTVDEVVNWLTEKNCGYKDYIVEFEDSEVLVNDITKICIETMDGDKKWY